MPTTNYPNNTLERRAIEAGAQVRCLWQMRGPKDTGVAWLECLQIGPRGDVVIVETFHHGGWNAFSAPHSNRVYDTITDVLERCGVKPAAGSPGSAAFRLENTGPDHFRVVEQGGTNVAQE